MKSLATVLVGALAAVAAMPAYAHGEGAVIGPAALGGLGIGAIAGAWAGWKGSHPGIALGWAVAALFLALVVWAGIEGELLLGALLFVIIVPFAGAIPMAVGASSSCEPAFNA